MPAVTFVNSLQGGDSTDRTTGYSTASWTPAANKLHILSIYSTQQTGTAVQIDTPTGNGITWTSVAFRVGGNRVLSIWKGSSASPTTGAITFTTSGVNHLGAAWTVSTADNADLTTPIVQSAVNSGTASSGTVTLAAFADATNNATFGVFGIVANQSPVVGSGFTGVGTRFQGTPNTAMTAEYVTGQDTSVDATWTGWGSAAWCGVAFEVAMDSAGPGAQTLVGTGYADSDDFGAGGIASSISLAGTGYANINAFGSGSIINAQQIAGTGYSDTDAFGAGSLTTAITIVGTGTANSQAYGSGTITQPLPGTTITGTGFANTSAFGNGTLTKLITLVGTGYSDTDAFGSGSVSTLTSVAGSGFVNLNSFGSGILSNSYVIIGTSYIDADSFGGGTISSTVSVTGTGYADPDNFGNGAVSLANQVIYGTGWQNGSSDKKYYMDTNGNVYWIISEELSLVDKI